MRLQVRVTALTVEPSDTSGCLVTVEVADINALRESVFRDADDGADEWPLAKRYGEVCEARRKAEARVAELEALLRRALDVTHHTARGGRTMYGRYTDAVFDKKQIDTLTKHITAALAPQAPKEVQP